MTAPDDPADSGPDVEPGPESADAPASGPRLIRAPDQPVGEPLTGAAQITDAARRLASGSGPIAIDAERASGYRYSQRAYLVQLWRAGTGTVLIDPIPTGDLAVLRQALGGTEWILHAASQDLPSLREVGMEPERLFDTEVAGRLLGLERVSLAAMMERFLDLTLEKGHSAADWSTRPLPAEWLVYAALDVEFLVDLRDAVAAELDRTGKREWAEQEFAAELTAAAPQRRSEPWRRTSGIHALRSRRQLAALRALWEARDALAAERDIAPGRVLPDAAIIAAVRANPASVADLVRLPTFKGPRQRQHAARWFEPLAAARALGDTDLPQVTGRGDGDGIPPASRWRERDPRAADRLAAVRVVVAELADRDAVQSQNLLAADLVRRLAWTPPADLRPESVATTLHTLGARDWQVELTAAPVAAVLQALPTTD